MLNLVGLQASCQNIARGELHVEAPVRQMSIFEHCRTLQRFLSYLSLTDAVADGMTAAHVDFVTVFFHKG